jgi:hypothetical protein
MIILYLANKRVQNGQNHFEQSFHQLRSLSYKTFLADIVVIYDVILTLEKSASIAIVMYENKIELLSKQKKS